MHIRDGFLSPEVCIGTGLLAAGAVGWSLYKLRDSLADRTVPLTGMTAALIFAGQMINFPLPGLPVSGHLLGGVLAGALLGPFAGCIALTIVLFVQLALYYDGGWTVFGANVLNMAVLGGIGGTALYSMLRRACGETRTGVLIATALAAWFSVVAAAGLFSLEFMLSYPERKEQLLGVFGWMLAYHLLIGIGEALITTLVISVVLQQRPDLLALPQKRPGWLSTTGRFVGAGLVVALAIAAFLSPWASKHDDGLKAVSTKVGFDDLGQNRGFLVWDDYAIPALAETYPAVSVGLAGIIGTLVVLACAWGLTWILQKRRTRQSGESQHAG